MKVLLLGDEMVDIYHIGTISRLNPESHKAPLLRVCTTLTFPGGAANVAANLRQLGVNVDTIYGNRTCCKRRLIDDDGIIARFDFDNISDPIIHLPNEKYDAVVVSDYGKGSIDDALAEKVDSKFGSLPIFVDAKVKPQRWLGIASCMFPNEKEFNENRATYNLVASTLIKLGSGGAKLVSSGGCEVLTSDSVATAVKNVTGAGDTVLAAYVAASQTPKTTRNRKQKMLDFAMAAAACAISNRYTYAPTLDEITKLVNAPWIKRSK